MATGDENAARFSRGEGVRRVALCLLILIAPLARAESGVWGERGIIRRIAVRAPLLFEADGRGVSVYDIRTNEPRRAGTVPTADESLDLAVGDDLYVITRGELARFSFAGDGLLALRSSIATSDYHSIAAGDGVIATVGASRLTIWSTATETPIVVAELAPPGVVSAVAFHGSQLWVAVQGQAIYGYDLARGAQPLGAIVADAHDLAIRGDTLFAAAGVGGLVIANVSDVANPRIVSRTGAGELNLLRVAAGTNRIYAAESAEVIDVFDLDGQQLGQIHDHAQTLAADGTRLFTGGSDVDKYGLIHATPQRFAVYDNAAFAGGFTDALQGPVSGAATDGTFAYVVDWPWFRVLDISTPSQTKQIAAITFDGLQDFVKIRNGLAIVWGRAKLNLIDIHDPWHPKLLGTFNSFGIAGGGATFAGDTIIEANPTTGMHLLDFFRFTTPDKPVQIGSVTLHYYEAVTLFPVVYGFDLTVMRVIDAGDPQHAHIVREINVPYGPAAITNGATPYLVVESLDHFRIFDLTDPLKPVEISTAPLPPALGVVTPDGDGVLVARAGAVDRLDIGNPLHPQLANTGMKAVAPMQIGTAGGKVVIADRYALRVYGDVTPAPQEPPARLRPVRR
jgi:hypothetical protein